MAAFPGQLFRTVMPGFTRHCIYWLYLAADHAFLLANDRHRIFLERFLYLCSASPPNLILLALALTSPNWTKKPLRQELEKIGTAGFIPPPLPQSCNYLWQLKGNLAEATALCFDNRFVVGV